MSLEWRILINGKYEYNKERGVPDPLEQTGMVLERYYSPVNYVDENGLNRYYPLFRSEQRHNHEFTIICASDMKRVAKRLAKNARKNKAHGAGGLRVAAWLWSWADQDEPGHRIALEMCY